MLARRAVGFDMRVIYHNRSRVSPESEAKLNAEYASKEDLLKRADHVVLVLPYTKENHHTIGAAELALRSRLLRSPTSRAAVSSMTRR